MACLRKILTILLLPLLAACGSDPVSDISPDGDDNLTYLQLRFSLPRSSRANPTGGEEGDGREDGINNENKIYNVTLFFYGDNGTGLDNPYNVPFKSKAYIDFSAEGVKDGGFTYEYALKDYEPEAGDRVAVVANMGDMTAKISDLDALRKAVVEQAWVAAANIPAYDRFTMATALNNNGANDAKDGVIDVNREGSKAQPYLASVTLERTAARIDLWFNASQKVSTPYSGLKYSVKGSDGSDVGDVYLIAVEPVNVMQKPSYVLKRVTSASDLNNFGSVLYCGDEVFNPAASQYNYVVEPQTALKSVSNDLVGWYGDTRAEYVRANYGGTPLLDLVNTAGQSFACTQAGYTFDTSVILDYANENTQAMSLHDSNYITGLVFKAQYLPSKVYCRTLTQYTAGIDALEYIKIAGGFWRFTKPNQTMAEEDAIYIAEKNVYDKYRREHPDEMEEFFPEGICYYNLWLRHANLDTTDPHQSCPMEYATVRNNIYRVALTFTGPGDITVTLREPNTMQTRIFVRKWNLREHPEIVM